MIQHCFKFAYLTKNGNDFKSTLLKYAEWLFNKIKDYLKFILFSLKKFGMKIRLSLQEEAKGKKKQMLLEPVLACFPQSSWIAFCIPLWQTSEEQMALVLCYFFLSSLIDIYSYTIALHFTHYSHGMYNN